MFHLAGSEVGHHHFHLLCPAEQSAGCQPAGGAASVSLSGFILTLSGCTPGRFSPGLRVTGEKVFQISFTFPLGMATDVTLISIYFLFTVLFAVLFLIIMRSALYASSSRLGYQLLGLYHFHCSLYSM